MDQGWEGERGVCGPRGLSYSLPVTYYELIPTAPVKYYCKILTVICARERDAGTSSASARVCPRSPGAPTNCLVALSHFLSGRLYPSSGYLFRPPPLFYGQTGRRNVGGLLRARESCSNLESLGATCSSVSNIS